MPTIVTQDESDRVDSEPRFDIDDLSVDVWRAGCNRFGPERFGAYILTKHVGLPLRLAATILSASPGTICKRAKFVENSIRSASN